MAINIGNTNVLIGVYGGEKLMASWRAATDLYKTVDEYVALLDGFFAQRGLDSSRVEGTVIASVVPTLTETFVALARKFVRHEPVVVGPKVKTGMSIRTDAPQQVGADRVAHAVGARHLYGTPAIVIDFGTATTFDVISKEGDFLGGIIAPGIGISADALYEHTAKLPRIDLVMPERAIGKNTVDAMRSGVLYGYVGLVEGLIKRIRQEIGEEARVVATGGFAHLIADQTPLIEKVNENLTLEGLRFIYQINKPSPQSGEEGAKGKDR